MPFWRRAVLFAASAFLTLFLFAAAVDIGVLRLVGQPGPIEKTLDKSGIYNSVVPGLLDEAKTISSPSGNVPLTDPIVRSAAEQTLTPQYLKTNVNSSLNSIYDWLDGKTSQPQFKVNLIEVRDNFADKVAAGVKQKAAGLPACTTFSSASSFDAFQATCLPPGVSPDQAATQARNSIVSGQGFLDKSSISANDIKANNSSQPVFQDQLKDFPQKYHKLKQSPFTLIFFSILMLALVIFLAENWRKGLRHAGFMLLGVGLFVILFGLGIKGAVNNKLLPGISLNNHVLQDSVRTVVRDLTQSLSGNYETTGIIYALLGVVAIVSFYFLFKEKSTQPVEQQTKASTAVPKPSKTSASKKK